MTLFISERGSISPTDEGRGPRISGSERGQDDEVARPDPAGLDGLVERDRDGRRRRVADAVDVPDDLLARDLQALGDHERDAVVGLVGDEGVDVLDAEAVRLEAPAGR